MKTLIGFVQPEASGRARPWPAALLLLLRLGVAVLLAQLLFLFLGSAAVGQTIVHSAVWVTQFIGPVWVALVPLALATLWAALILVAAKVRGLNGWTPLAVQVLRFGEDTAPVLGLLGTFVGLSALMIGLDATLPTADLVALLVHRGGQAFGSSVAGVIVQLGAYGARFFFTGGEDQCG